MDIRVSNFPDSIHVNEKGNIISKDLDNMLYDSFSYSLLPMLFIRGFPTNVNIYNVSFLGHEYNVYIEKTNYKGRCNNE